MFWETFKLSLRTLRGNRFRTALTMLSVTIGAFSIVVMLSLAQSGHKTLSHEVEAVGGMRLILWFPSEGVANKRNRNIYNDGFTDEDMRLLRQLPFVESVTSQSTYGRSTVFSTADKTEQPDVVGMTAGALEGMRLKVDQGRTLTEEDGLRSERVAVLTAGLSKALFGSGTALGQTVNVFGKPYVVVGVLEDKKPMSIQFGFDWDKSVFVPQLTAEKREGKSLLSKLLVMQTAGPSYNKIVVQMGSALLKAQHRGVEDYSAINFGDMLDQFYQFFLILDAIVAVIAGVSLVAGGIGVMNIMLVSVTERIREIGIRKAVGATVVHIMSQFLMEAMVLSMVGGVFGVLSGLGVTAIAHVAISHFQPTWLGTYSFMGVGIALGVTAFIGLVFGSVPAWRAARLTIVEALRR